LASKTKLDEEKLRSPYFDRKKILQQSNEEEEEEGKFSRPAAKPSSPARIRLKSNINSPKIPTNNDENLSRHLRNHKKVDYTQMFLLEDKKRITPKEVSEETSDSDKEENLQTAPPPVKRMFM
jgi:hypothetical protein